MCTAAAFRAATAARCRPERSVDEHDVRRWNAAERRVPRNRVTAGVREHDALTHVGRIDNVLADHIFLVAGRPRDQHIAARSRMRRPRDQLDLTPAQVTYAR